MIYFCITKYWFWDYLRCSNGYEKGAHASSALSSDIESKLTNLYLLFASSTILKLSEVKPNFLKMGRSKRHRE